MCEKETSLGSLIREYRHRKKQMNNNRPWSQEDLAVAIGSDKSHINRLEKGHQIPAKATLIRICEALELTWEEQRKMISLAGYYSNLPAPSDDEVERMVQKATPYLRTLHYPATINDSEGLLWTANDLEAYTFYGYRDTNKFLFDCQGFRIIELLMTPKFNDWFHKTLCNYDEYLVRQLLRFKKQYLHHVQDYEYQNIRKRLLSISEFREKWQKVEEGTPDADLLLLDHQVVKFQHPELGYYEIQIFHSELSSDERFQLIRHIPNNDDTRLLFDNLYQVLSKRYEPLARTPQ